MSSVQEIEDFFGVYCLCSKSPNPRFKNRVYIGFTVDPNRRIKQHNRGAQFGGAKRTSNRGPWVMTMIIHGFPNKIAALRFEWAWQKPARSRILSSIPSLKAKRPRESDFDYHQRILSEMLRIPPWNRLPLTVQWLNDDFFRDFPVGCAPPMHMPIQCGKVKIRPKPTAPYELLERIHFCSICESIIDNGARELLTCLNVGCKMSCHIICLAQRFLQDDPGEIIPVQGRCPECNVELIWGDLIRKAKGCCDVVTDLTNDDGPLEIEDVSDDGGEGDGDMGEEIVDLDSD